MHMYLKMERNISPSTRHILTRYRLFGEGLHTAVTTLGR